MSCVGESLRRQPSAPQRFFAAAAANESEADAAPSVGSSGITKVGFADVSWGEPTPKEEELEDILKRRVKEESKEDLKDEGAHNFQHVAVAYFNFCVSQAKTTTL